MTRIIVGDALTDRAAIAVYWRKRPVVLVGAIKCSDDVARLLPSWCKPPVVCRAYGVPDPKTGATAAEFISRRAARSIMRGIDQERENRTVLLNGVERVSESVESLRKSCATGAEWRKDDAVVTYSPTGSGIGFHAGHEDGFVVQLQGRRRWRVWSPDELPRDYRLSILGCARYSATPTPARPRRRPLVDVILTAGDALYVPPLHGHEGVTVQRSVSLSLAWRGITVYTVLISCLPDRISEIKEAADRAPDEFFAILEDPSPSIIDSGEFLNRSAAARLRAALSS